MILKSAVFATRQQQHPGTRAGRLQTSAGTAPARVAKPLCAPAKVYSNFLIIRVKMASKASI